ncbi:MAG: hypothetical protein AAGA86_06560 [Bacteroidota bacterium]
MYKIVAMGMAFMLLASTTTWSVGKHYCMGLLVELSFFAHAADCRMDGDMGQEGLFALEQDDSCCNDQLVVVQGQRIVKGLSHQTPTLDKVHLNVAQSFLFPGYSRRPSQKILTYEYYPPPPLVKDIQLLDEVFLI